MGEGSKPTRHCPVPVVPIRVHGTLSPVPGARWIVSGRDSTRVPPWSCSLVQGFSRSGPLPREQALVQTLPRASSDPGSGCGARPGRLRGALGPGRGAVPPSQAEDRPLSGPEQRSMPEASSSLVSGRRLESLVCAGPRQCLAQRGSQGGLRGALGGARLPPPGLCPSMSHTRLQHLRPLLLLRPVSFP